MPLEPPQPIAAQFKILDKRLRVWFDQDVQLVPPVVGGKLQMSWTGDIWYPPSPVAVDNQVTGVCSKGLFTLKVDTVDYLPPAFWIRGMTGVPAPLFVDFPVNVIP